MNMCWPAIPLGGCPAVRSRAPESDKDHNYLGRSPMRRTLLTRLVRGAAVTLLAAAAVVAMPGPARAASNTQVTSFGSNPGNLNMYAYRPDNLPSGAPAVVLLHGCTQNANAYYTNSGWK